MTREERDALVEANIRLVPWVIRKQMGIGTAHNAFDDYMSAGYLGLFKAANAFDPGKGFAFSTFARRCVFNEIIAEKRRTDRRAAVLSLDGETTYAETIMAANGDPHEELEKQDDIENLRKAVESLRQKDAELMRELYGLSGGEAMKQAELAKRLGVSRPRISRRAAKAIRRLREILSQ